MRFVQFISTKYVKMFGTMTVEKKRGRGEGQTTWDQNLRSTANSALQKCTTVKMKSHISRKSPSPSDHTRSTACPITYFSITPPMTVVESTVLSEFFTFFATILYVSLKLQVKITSRHVRNPGKRL